MAFLIGIDCGKHTGIAVWDTDTQKFIRLETMPIHKALFFVYDLRQVYPTPRVYFEDARQRKWLPRERNASEYRGKLMGAGSVKRDAAIWQDALTDWRIPFEMVPPRAGLTKWDTDYFMHVTGYTGTTSEHSRDAALLVFGRK
jgi:hypothetical protein